MKSIEITTSHNIAVSFELATLPQRYIAGILDSMIVGIYVAFMSGIASSSTVVMYLLILPVVGFYHLFFEIFNNGQTLGKKGVGIRVVSLSGAEPTVNDIVMRWMFRTIDITLSFTTLGALLIGSTVKRQRLGDILANTTVVRSNNENSVNLEKIKNIGDQDIEILYPGISQYSDTDMLLVKEAISRSKQSNSEGNRKLIKELSEKIMKDLEVKKKPTNAIKFLESVLREYILLTR